MFCGSRVNVISKSLLQIIAPDTPIEPYLKKIYAFQSKDPLPTLGTAKLQVKFATNVITSQFVIVPDKSITILGRKDAITLNLLRIGPPTNNSELIIY